MTSRTPLVRRRSAQAAFRRAQERYAEHSVDVARAMEELARIRISVQCWQGDDVRGFETGDHGLGGGLAVTGNHPGRARNAGELRADLEQAFSLIPGRHRLNLHAIYAEVGTQKVERDALEPAHFREWIAWAKAQKLALDFNPTCFAHPQAADGFTLAHPKRSVRQFWVEHCRRAREIGSAMGRALGSPCITNVWIPDGFKDTPADRLGPRERLRDSLDQVFQREFPKRTLLDAIEPKLFGIGAESYTVGSHEFYLGYAITRQKLLCLDAGHFHPTESVADKISSVVLYLPEVLLHVSRGVRWDSDHVVTLTDELEAIAREVVANGLLRRVHFGLDYFDASINRIAAWVIGTRALLKAILLALLEPPAIRAAESEGDFTRRLALQEATRSLPFGEVWDAYCESHDVPPDPTWLSQVHAYEKKILHSRR